MSLTFLQILEIVVVIAILGVVTYWGASTFFKVRASRDLMADAVPYELRSDDHRSTLLVIGDSLGVGVGASKPEEAIPGRLAHYLGATHVENYSVIGAGVEDLAPQIAKATLPRYDVILVQVGGNNILAFDNVRWTGRILGEVFAELPESGKVILMSAGNAGGATLFPPPVRFFHTRTNLLYNKEFERVAHAWGVTYVDLYMPPSEDPFMQNPGFYLAADGLHPSSEGYQVWFEKLTETLGR